MGFFGSKSKESHIDRVQRILSFGEEFTKLEKECIAQAYERLIPAGSVVHRQVKDSVTAFGLWVCKDVLWQTAMDKNNMFEALSKLDLESANYAMAKAYYIFPLPVFLFRIGYILEFMNDPTTNAFLQSYLTAESKFKPTDIQQALLDLILPVKDYKGRSIDPVEYSRTVLANS